MSVILYNLEKIKWTDLDRSSKVLILGHEMLYSPQMFGGFGHCGGVGKHFQGRSH